MRKLVQSVDSDALAREPLALEILVSGSLAQSRSYVVLLGGFAALVLVFGIDWTMWSHFMFRA
jgi:hypothetical protein